LWNRWWQTTKDDDKLKNSWCSLTNVFSHMYCWKVHKEKLFHNLTTLQLHAWHHHDFQSKNSIINLSIHQIVLNSWIDWNWHREVKIDNDTHQISSTIHLCLHQQMTEIPQHRLPFKHKKNTYKKSSPFAELNWFQKIQRKRGKKLTTMESNEAEFFLQSTSIGSILESQHSCKIHWPFVLFWFQF